MAVFTAAKRGNELFRVVSLACAHFSFPEPLNRFDRVVCCILLSPWFPVRSILPHHILTWIASSTVLSCLFISSSRFASTFVFTRRLWWTSSFARSTAASARSLRSHCPPCSSMIFCSSYARTRWRRCRRCRRATNNSVAMFSCCPLSLYCVSLWAQRPAHYSLFSHHIIIYLAQ